ncbi:MAG: potassium-transporting ATPase subunit C [Archangium sp.]|nr:potassium-transporting ATPase subunit C [Archangium sp.]
MIRPALVLLTFFTLVTGVAWPLALTVFDDGKLAPGAVTMKVFDGPGDFWSRPSAGTPTASSGSNLGPTNPAFLEAVKKRVEAMRAAHPTQSGPVPAELITASGSGLDPDLSVAGAKYQLDRVALARGVTRAKLEELVDAHTQPRFIGIFGEPRVNVTRLNLALAALAPLAATPPPPTPDATLDAGAPPP